MLIKSMVIVSQKQEQVHLQTLNEIQIRPAFPKNFYSILKQIRTQLNTNIYHVVPVLRASLP